MCHCFTWQSRISVVPHELSLCPLGSTLLCSISLQMYSTEDCKQLNGALAIIGSAQWPCVGALLPEQEYSTPPLCTTLWMSSWRWRSYCSRRAALAIASQGWLQWARRSTASEAAIACLSPATASACLASDWRDSRYAAFWLLNNRPAKWCTFQWISFSFSLLRLAPPLPEDYQVRVGTWWRGSERHTQIHRQTETEGHSDAERRTRPLAPSNEVRS